MIDLKQVAEMAKQDSEIRGYVTWVFRNDPDSGPDNTFRRLAETSISMAEQLTEDLARRAAADDTNMTH